MKEKDFHSPVDHWYTIEVLMRDATSLRYNLNSDNHQFDTVVVVHHLCVDHLLVNLEMNKKNRDNVKNESE